MTQKYTGLNYLQHGLSPTSDCFLHSPWWKFHFCYFHFYVIPKIKELYWRNSLNKWNVSGWLYSASKKIIFISEKRKKHKPIWLLPNAYLSNFLRKSKVHVQRNKENEDLPRCIRTVLYSTRTKEECHEWWAL